LPTVASVTDSPRVGTRMSVMFHIHIESNSAVITRESG
jgi:hypothetical protein